VSIVDDHVQLSLGNQLKLHRAGFKAVAAVPQFQTTPIYVTEADPEGCAACPVSSSPANAYRTSPAYGAYELAMMKHSLELEADIGVRLGGLLTWAFTFPGTPYFAGYRALATNGIQLPVLAAFELLGRLDGARLPLNSSGARTLDDILANGVRGDPDIDGMATRSGSAIQVLVWNYHDDLVKVPTAAVHLTIQLPAGFGANARVTHLRVDEQHGDAYTLWVAQGQPSSPSPAQIAALQQAMVPSVLVPERTVQVTGSAVELDFDLPRFGVSLLTISPAVGASDGGSSGSAASPLASGDCACRIGIGANNAADPAALVMGVLMLARTLRRSRDRSVHRAPPSSRAKRRRPGKSQ